MITLETKDRNNVSENAEDLRGEGFIPAVLYGKKTPATSVSLVLKDFIKVWKQAGESSVVSLKTSKGIVDVLIQDVDVHPVTDVPRHADFYVFEKGKKIEVSVPLEFVGVSPAIKDLGGSLVKALFELKISAEPQNLPHDIKVDISPLVTFEDQILASDVKLPVGVELIELATEVVATVTEPKTEEVEESAPIDLSAIEVEKKGKKEEEGAEEATA